MLKGKMSYMKKILPHYFTTSVRTYGCKVYEEFECQFLDS